MKKAFKKGQWLIRIWEEENGGETDFVLFEAPISDKKFYYSKFYRIPWEGVEDLSNEQTVKEIEYEDDRMSLQFRAVTKAEFLKYATIIISN